MIYLDNNATTMMDPRVLDSMIPYFSTIYGNPSNTNSAAGIKAQNAVTDAMYKIADFFHAPSINDFVITSGATESNNLAISGILQNCVETAPHAIVSCVEHPSILNVCRYWEQKGVKFTYLPVGSNGIVDTAELESAVRPETVLISVMAANNEIGTIQPIAEIAAIAQKHNILFHTDAVQLLYSESIDVQKIPVNMISFSGHKLHGPKGIGGLYMDAKARAKIQPILFGGGQQKNLRSGTLNVPGIIGLAEALEYIKQEQKSSNRHLLELKELFLNTLQSRCTCTLNGDAEKRIPNNLNICIPGILSLALISRLPDICISRGSACSANKSSHVLKEIGLSRQQQDCSVRIGFSKFTTKEEVLSAALSIAAMHEERKQ